MSTFDKQVGGSHYQKFAIQPTVFLQANQNMLGWCESNAIKYACRHGFKNGRQDIEKAIHYLEMVLEKDYPVVEAEFIDGPCSPDGPNNPDIILVPKADITTRLDGPEYATTLCECPSCKEKAEQEFPVATCDDCEELLGKGRCQMNMSCPRQDEIDTAKRLKSGL